MRAAAILVPLAGVIPKVASFAERRSNPITRETGHPSDEMMPLADVVLRGISPAVTAAPKPRYVGANLFAREGESNTCGYLHYYDDPNDDVYPLTCDPAYICTNVGTMRDCCRSSRCASATFSTSCLDSTACPVGGPDTGTFCCTSTQYPYCVSYLWSSSTNTDEIFTLINCRVDTSNRIGTLEAESTSSTSSPKTTIRSTTTSPIPTTTSPAPDPNDGGGTPVGAIVGGVVGGVAAIGLAAIAILFLVRKRKREATEASSPPPPQPNTQGSPPMQQPQQPYNPHQSYQSSQQPFNAHQSFYGHTPTSPDPTSIYPSPAQSPGPFQAYNPANGPATSPGPQYSIQPTPPGFVPQTYIEPSKAGPDVHTVNTVQTPSPGVPSSTSPGATGGFQSPQNVHTVQQPGQYVEAPAINPVGSTENRAELG